MRIARAAAAHEQLLGIRPMRAHGIGKRASGQVRQRRLQVGGAPAKARGENARVAARGQDRDVRDAADVRDDALRVLVSGGGCSGFQYVFTFDEVSKEDDTAMVKDSVTLLIAPMSYRYLVGAEIDCQEGLEAALFVIKNPNATTTCGCGSSFSA